MSAPVLIVGQGLAGTALAWRLHERGQPFLVVDPAERETCSKVAAGLITPVTGQRLKASWRFGEFWEEASAFYRALEVRLGVPFLRELDQVRLFRDEREVSRWRTQGLEPEIARWVDASAPLADATVFRTELGGFVQRPAGWLDTATYLEASRAFFERAGAWLQGRVIEEELREAEDRIIWGGREFSAVVFCRGEAERREGRAFSWLRFDCARGVIASLRAELRESRIVNRGCWILPTGGGQWRAGSTYEFEPLPEPADSVADLRRKLEAMLRIPFELEAPRWGIRPIIKRRSAVLGRHPSRERVLLFNGLGSKGALRSPGLARMLADHLVDGAPLEAEADVRSND